MKSKFSKIERRALSYLFLPFGIGGMAIATRFPELRDQLDINNGTFGTILSLGGIGSLLGFILVGNWVHSYGVKPIVTFGSTGLFASLALYPHMHNANYFLLLNIFASFCWTSFHIANNAQAIH